MIKHLNAGLATYFGKVETTKPVSPQKDEKGTKPGSGGFGADTCAFSAGVAGKPGELTGLSGKPGEPTGLSGKPGELAGPAGKPATDKPVNDKVLGKPFDKGAIDALASDLSAVDKGLDKLLEEPPAEEPVNDEGFDLKAKGDDGVYHDAFDHESVDGEGGPWQHADDHELAFGKAFAGEKHAADAADDSPQEALDALDKPVSVPHDDAELH